MERGVLKRLKQLRAADAGGTWWAFSMWGGKLFRQQTRTDFIDDYGTNSRHKALILLSDRSLGPFQFVSGF
jgi:hypothetical protein